MEFPAKTLEKKIGLNLKKNDWRKLETAYSEVVTQLNHAK